MRTASSDNHTPVLFIIIMNLFILIHNRHDSRNCVRTPSVARKIMNSSYSFVSLEVAQGLRIGSVQGFSAELLVLLMPVMKFLLFATYLCTHKGRQVRRFSTNRAQVAWVFADASRSAVQLRWCRYTNCIFHSIL